jgi:hypothetical protein
MRQLAAVKEAAQQLEEDVKQEILYAVDRSKMQRNMW